MTFVRNCFVKELNRLGRLAWVGACAAVCRSVVLRGVRRSTAVTYCLGSHL